MLGKRLTLKDVCKNIMQGHMVDIQVFDDLFVWCGFRKLKQMMRLLS